MNSLISELIAADLAAHPDFFNSHGLDLHSCLQTPTKLRFANSFRDGEFLELWLVLKEAPDSEEGYLVVFDESRGEFGLAIYGTTCPVFIGYYGSFTETLTGM